MYARATRAQSTSVASIQQQMQEITNKRMQILDPLAYRTRPACRLQHQTLDHLEQNPNNPGATNINGERGDARTRSWDRPGRRGT